MYERQALTVDNRALTIKRVWCRLLVLKDKQNSMKKDPVFTKLGGMGGAATFKKYGSDHYKMLSKKGRAALKKKLDV